MSLSRSMKHDPICVILSAFAFTFDSPNLLVFSVKDYGSLMLKLKCSHLFLFYSFPVQLNILKKHVLIGLGVFYIKFWPWHFAAFINFLLQTFVPNLVSVTRPSLQWLGKTRRGIFDIRTSGQFLIDENCYSSSTSQSWHWHETWLVTKLGTRNTATSKKCYWDDVMLANCDVIVFFPICDQFAAIQKPDSGRMVHKTYISINNNLLSCKIWNRAKKSLTQHSYYCLE